MDRPAMEQLLRELYEARVRGDLQGLMRIFTEDARLEIAGATYTTPVTIRATGSADLRSWLALLVKTFTVTEHAVLSLVVDGTRAAVHWQAKVRSRITGASVLTEFIDVIVVRD